MYEGPRNCVICGAVFKPADLTDWHCSDECRGELETIGELNMKAAREVEALQAAQTSEVTSEAELARRALAASAKVEDVQPNPSAARESIRISIGIGRVAARARDPADALALLNVAGAFMARAISELGGDDEDRDSVPGADDLSQGPARPSRRSKVSGGEGAGSA